MSSQPPGENKDHASLVAELRQRTHDLGERVKELTCLYTISKVSEEPGVSLERIFQAVVEIIPRSWQYPGITHGRITFDGREFRTRGFRESRWKQEAGIVVNKRRAGSVEVYYVEKRPELAEGPFLEEERDLIDDIAVRLALIVERRQVEEDLRESEQRYRTLVELSPDGIFVHRKDKVLFVNPASVRLLGARNAEDLVGRSVLSLIHHDYRDASASRTKSLRRGRETLPIIQSKLIRCDGEVIDIEGTTSKALFDGEYALISTFRVITERKRLEARNSIDKLTPRERQVFKLVAAGETSKAIGLILGINIKTVEIHRGRMMRKMEASSLADLIRKASLAKD